ncbi:MAG: hypothetical protein GYB65_02860, partial [Chloroflexi bacterium]|nr:hypothetical protein [Chloroflexota bacterium]
MRTRLICLLIVMFTIGASIAGASGGAQGTRTTIQDPGPTSPFGFHPASITHPEYSAGIYDDAQTIGVGWTREPVYAFWFLVQPDLVVGSDLNSPVYDFQLYDRMYGSVPPGISILGNIAPQGRP